MASYPADSNDGIRKNLLKSLFGEEKTSDILANPRGPQRYERIQSEPDGSNSSSPHARSLLSYGWRNLLQTYFLWTALIIWVLAMLVGGSLVLSRAVYNDHLASQLQKQQETLVSEFCEFCRPESTPPVMLKTSGVYEVDPTTSQFPAGYKTPGHQCILETGEMTSSLELEYNDLVVTDDGILVITNARLAPRADSVSNLPFLMNWESVFYSATSTSSTRCVIDSTLPYTGQVIFYLVVTPKGPFPCLCEVDSGVEQCYNYPKDMGNVNPIIDNSNSGIIP